MTAVFDDPLWAPLYGDPEVAAHLTAEAQVAAMIEVEAALAEVEAAAGVIPAGAGPAIAAALGDLAVAPGTLAAGTEAAGIPVPALVARLREAVGPPHGGYVHWGASSQDILDTGLVLRLRAALTILEARLAALVARLTAEARTHARTPMAGRTRTQVATPTTLGLRIAGWAAPLGRARDRLGEMRPRLLVVQLGGASGSLSVLGPAGPGVMDALADRLGLHRVAKPRGPERDHIVELGHWCAQVAGALGRMAGDIALMGRSEIAELTLGQGGGSSTMPQKANPVLAETVVALARHVAGASATLTGALLHQEERDGAAWATEWTVLPQMLVATGAALRHAQALADGLRPDTGAMAARLAADDGVHAEAMAFALAAHMPLPEAQAMLKTAARRRAAEGGRLADHLAPLCAERGVPVPAADAGPALDAAEVLVHRVAAEIGRAP